MTGESGSGAPTSEASRQFEIEIRGARDSAFLIGDHGAINTPQGTRVIRSIGSEAVAAPRLRPLPVELRPDRPAPFFGRATERELAARASAGSPLQFHGAVGVGKSTLFKELVFEVPPGDEGVVHAKVRRRELYDIQAQLFKAFWESQVRFTPAPEEMPDFLAERQALVVLDDVGLDRPDLEELVEGLPHCTLVVGSDQQTLWAGTAEPLDGLDVEAGRALLEDKLGRPLADHERGAADRVVTALDGYPQRLVEAAALVRNGTRTLDELADGATWQLVRAGPGPDDLTQPQLRVLAVLRTADAPLGTDRIAELAEVPDAAQVLKGLEDDGWVRSASPRYSLAREPPLGTWRLPERRCVDGLRQWVIEDATPEDVVAEAEAIETLLDHETDDPTLAGTQAGLARAAEGQFALAGMLDGWEQVLRAGLTAARTSNNRADEAYMLHQLGSRALCLDDLRLAGQYLTDALAIREAIGDAKGAELTRSNLDQLGGGGQTPDGDQDGGQGGDGKRVPRRGPALAAVGILIVAAGVLALTQRNSHETHPAAAPAASHVTRNSAPAATPAARPSSPAGRTHGGAAPAGKPKIDLSSPAQGGVYRARSTVVANFTCVAGSRPLRGSACSGTVPDGKRVDTTPGPHTFTVVARSPSGRTARKVVTYTVTAPRSPPPKIDITTPAEGGTYTESGNVPAAYTCTDPDGSASPKCDGTVPSGSPIDTSKGGDHTFTVNAVSSAGRTATATVHYTVEPG